MKWVENKTQIPVENKTQIPIYGYQISTDGKKYIYVCK